MPYVSHQELNQFIKNMRGDIGLREREAHHAAFVREWFIGNLSNIGRYAHRDFERFGSLVDIEGSADHHDRQDGWVGVTHEVPHIDHLTYGTGITYIEGEMEIPYYEDHAGDNIRGDEFYHTTKGGVEHIWEPALDRWHWLPDPGDLGPMGQSLAPGKDAGYKWMWEDVPPDIPEYWYQWITENVGGEYITPKIGVEPFGTKTTPTEFNDADLYHVDTDRNHYPWVVVQSSQPLSMKRFLESWTDDLGMYPGAGLSPFDGLLPELAYLAGTYPPVVWNGITYVKGGVKGILDFISPVNDTP